MRSDSSGKTNPLSIILLIFVMIAALIPAVYNFILTLVDYSPVHGLFSSPSAGLSNYSHVINDPVFFRLIINSFSLWLTSLCFALLLGFPVAILCSLIKSVKTAATCTGLLLIPAFIPASVYFALVIKLFTSSVFMREQTYILAFAAQTLLPGAALIAFSGTAFSLLYRSKGKKAIHGTVLGSGVVILIIMFSTLSPAYEAALLSANPLVNRVADTFDTFTYRRGLTQMQMSYSAALYSIRSFLQLFLAVIPVFAMIMLLKIIDQPIRPAADDIPAGLKIKAPGQIVVLILSVILVIGLLFATGLPEFNQISLLSQFFLPSFLITFLSAIVGLAVSLALFYGVSRSSGRVVVPITAAIVLGTNNAIIAQYLMLRQLGLINTILATPVTQWLQPSILVILFLFAFIVRFMKNHASLVLLAAAAAVFVGAHAYGGFIPHMILTSVPQQYTIGLVFRQSQSMADQIINTEAGTLSLIYIATVLPCLLLGYCSALLIRAGLIKAVNKLD